MLVEDACEGDQYSPMEWNVETAVLSARAAPEKQSALKTTNARKNREYSVEEGTLLFLLNVGQGRFGRSGIAIIRLSYFRNMSRRRRSCIPSQHAERTRSRVKRSNAIRPTDARAGRRRGRHEKKPRRSAVFSLSKIFQPKGIGTYTLAFSRCTSSAMLPFDLSTS
jgi:hypothetical protein